MIAIKINGEFVETNENLSVTLQQGVEEPSNITSRSFKHSYTISIENNSNNRRIFNYFDPKKTGNFNQVQVNSVEIFSDGTQIFQGNAKVTEITQDEIKFFCISEESYWVQEIQGNLNELSFGSGYTFYGARLNGTGYPSNAVFMTDFWTGNTSQGITTNEIIQFPLISYGNFYVGGFPIGRMPNPDGDDFFAPGGDNYIKDNTTVRVDFNETTTATTNSKNFIVSVTSPGFFNLIDYENGNILVSAYTSFNYYNNIGTFNIIEATEYYDVGVSPLNSINKYSVIHELEMEDIPPSINMKKTFDGIFSNIGWKIQSSFMESDNFKNLYLTYSGKKDPQWNWGTLSKVELSDTSLSIVSTNAYYGNSVGFNNYFFNFIEAGESIDYSSSYSTTNGYTVPKAGTYLITLYITGTTNFVFQTGIQTNKDRLQRNIIYLSKRSNSNSPDSFETDTDLEGFEDYFSSLSPTGNILNRDNIIWWFNTNWSATDPIGDTIAPYDYITVLNENYGFNDDTSELIRTITTKDQQIRQGGFGTTNFDYTYYLQLFIQTTLKKGEKIKLTNAIGSPYTTSAASSTIDGIECSFQLIKNEDGTDAELTFKAENFMPEMSKIDYVKSILTSFNLYSITDPINKSIVFEPRDNFILPSFLALDYSDKIFFDVKYYPFELSRFYEFGWNKDNNDIWSVPLDLIAGFQVWQANGDGTLYKNIANANADGSSKITSKIGYAAERQYHNALEVPNNSRNLSIPTMMRKEDEFVPQRNVSWTFNQTPKIIEWQGMRDGAFIFDEQLRMQYPYAASTYSTGMTLTWYDKVLFSASTINTLEKGMYSTFYNNQFNEYINSEMTEITFIISTKDYLELDTRKQIFWNECHYRVIDIQYQPSQKLAKLKMIKTNI